MTLKVLMIRKFVILFLFSCSSQFPQSDWVKWEKVNLNYARQKESTKRDYSISEGNFAKQFVKSLAIGYWFFISDVDGDNCPFSPSCSKFLIQAVEETNLPQGVLMFFDRFTRDLNIFNRENKYPRIGASHFYDPIQLYTLDKELINYIPPKTFIQAE